MSTPTRITRLPDRTLAKLSNELFATITASRINLYYAGNAVQSADILLELSEFSTKTYSIDRIEIYTPGGTKRIDICRGAYSGQNSAIDCNKFIQMRVSSPFDEYSVFPVSDQFSKEEAINIDLAFAPHRANALSDSSSETGLQAVVLSQLEQLRQLALDFSARQAEAEGRLETAYRKREDALQKRITAEEQKISERVFAEESKLVDERAELEKWRSEINDREPQHERRRLREALTDELRDYVTAPPTRGSKREWNANLTYLAAGAVFVSISAVLTLQSGISEAPTTAAFWTSATKSLLAGLGGAAFIWSGLAGLKASAKSAREYEQHIQRYSFDMDRASWIVETILQMSATESAKVPDEWLSSVCRDLFQSAAAHPEEARSLDALAALLDATARAKIGTSGIDFEIDRKGARKLVAKRG